VSCVISLCRFLLCNILLTHNLTCIQNSLVLNAKHLQKELNVTAEEICEMRNKCSFYNFLNVRRKELFAKKLLVDNDAVRTAENDHYRTVAMKNALVTG